MKVCKEALQRGGAAHVDYAGLLARHGRDSGGFFDAVESDWAWVYHRMTVGPRDLRVVTIRELTWMLDATTLKSGDEPDNRLIGVHGTSVPVNTARDDARMRGYPSPQRDHKSLMHRGHAAAHSLGGPDEGYNLFPQVATVNLGRQWRDQERFCAANPGTLFFVRAIFDDESDTPAALEYGVVRAPGVLDIRYFDNV